MSNNIQNVPENNIRSSEKDNSHYQQININLQGNNQEPVAKKSVVIAYILWFCFFGIIPLHWFYLGRVPIIRIITFNFFGLGALIDFFKLGQYVSAYNRGIL